MRRSEHYRWMFNIKDVGARSRACFVVESRKLAEGVARDIEDDVARRGTKHKAWNFRDELIML